MRTSAFRLPPLALPFRAGCRVALAGLLLATAACSRSPERLDLSDWQHLPVLHNGRLMPLDSFADSAVEVICDRQDPTLALRGAIASDELASDDFAAARQMFPDDRPRRFSSAELVLSWLVEPDKWESVPFLIAEHEALRTLLELPASLDAKQGGSGDHLRYASPRDVREALQKPPADAAGDDRQPSSLREVLSSVIDKQRQAQQSGGEPSLTGLEKAAHELFAAYRLYRQLTFDPRQVYFQGRADLGAPLKFAEQLDDLAHAWREVAGSLELFKKEDRDTGIGQHVAVVENSLRQMAELAADDTAPLEKVEPLVAATADAARRIVLGLSNIRDNAFRAGDAHADASMTNVRKELRRLASRTEQVARAAHGMHRALYDGGMAMTLVPAMSPEALERERSTLTDTRPWLSWQTVVSGSRSLLAAYPADKLADARGALDQLSKAYHDRQSPQREQNVKLASEQVARTLFALGTSIEPQRRQLIADPQRRDDEQLAHTAYPPPGFTTAEVHYNRVQPFFWSWVTSLAGAFCFALAFGALKRPMFWLGWGVMGAGLAWTIYGFALRVSITRFAPITNMYETVIFVPTLVTILGAWFTLLPLFWNGLKFGWRASALPDTWEAYPPSADQRQLMSLDSWKLAGWVLMAPRLLLMAGVVYLLAVAPYAAGGRKIINLLPSTDANTGWPDMNNVITWLVGWCVLIPTVWFLPRATISACVGFPMVPKTLKGRWSSVLPQVHARWPFALASACVATFFYLLAWYAPVLDKDFRPLQPVLRDNFWLVIHVITIVSSYGAGMLAWGLGLIAMGYYLFGRYRTVTPGHQPEGHRPAVTGAGSAVAPPLACASLGNYLYKAVQVAVVLLAAGTILGGLWADVSWGRFWGWDPKEVWALVSLLVYIAILHGRYAGWVGNFGLVCSSIVGFCTIAFSWYGVNFLLPMWAGKAVGLHSYGTGAGGQWYVIGFCIANLVFAAITAMRYNAAMFAAGASFEEPTLDGPFEPSHSPEPADLSPLGR